MPGQPDPPTRRVPATGRHRRAGAGRHRQRALVLLAVGAGGAAGSLARYQVGRAWPTPAAGFPWATFAVNLSGGLVLGALLALVADRWPPTRYVRPLFGTGVCGGYTTWSTFMTESALLVRDGRGGVAAAYLTATLAGGVMAGAAGLLLGRRWPTDARRSP